MNKTSINIVHSFLVLCTNYKLPPAGRGTNSRIKPIVNNLEGLDLDESTNNVEVRDDHEVEKKNTNPEPTIYDLQKSIKKMTGLFLDGTLPKRG